MDIITRKEKDPYYENLKKFLSASQVLLIKEIKDDNRHFKRVSYYNIDYNQFIKGNQSFIGYIFDIMKKRFFKILINISLQANDMEFKIPNKKTGIICRSSFKLYLNNYLENSILSKIIYDIIKHDSFIFETYPVFREIYEREDIIYLYDIFFKEFILNDKEYIDGINEIKRIKDIKLKMCESRFYREYKKFLLECKYKKRILQKFGIDSLVFKSITDTGFKEDFIDKYIEVMDKTFYNNNKYSERLKKRGLEIINGKRLKELEEEESNLLAVKLDTMFLDNKEME